MFCSQERYHFLLFPYQVCEQSAWRSFFIDVCFPMEYAVIYMSFCVVKGGKIFLPRLGSRIGHGWTI